MTESRGRKKSQVWDSPQLEPSSPCHSPHPMCRHSLVQAAAMLPLLAQPGPAWLGFPGHVQICGEREEGNEQHEEKGMPRPYSTWMCLWHQLPGDSRPLSSPGWRCPTPEHLQDKPEAGSSLDLSFLGRIGVAQGCAGTWSSSSCNPAAAPSHGCPIPRGLCPAETRQAPIRVAESTSDDEGN